MAFTDLLVQQAEIQRRPTDSKDRFGQPLEHWVVVGTHPCRIEATWSGAETDTERSREVFELGTKVYLLPDVDVKEDDQIRILSSGGSEIAPPGRVRHKQIIVGYNGTPHHLEVRLDVVRGAL